MFSICSLEISASFSIFSSGFSFVTIATELDLSGSKILLSKLVFTVVVM
jgi:hypothetical protein